MDILSKLFSYFCENIKFKLNSISCYMGKKNNNTEQENNAPRILDFVAVQKVNAFCKRYEPVTHQDYDTEVYNEIRLRNFFKADVCPYGDPLTVYLDILEQRGYTMTVSLQDEPVILVKEKYDANQA